MTSTSSHLSRAVRFLAVAWLILALLPLAPAFGQSPTPTLPPDLDQLVDMLTGADQLAAERAAQQLAAVGTAAVVPRLIDLFLTSDTPRLAATALGGIGTQRAIETLIDALVDEPLTPRRNAAQIGLLYGGEQAINELMSALRAPQATTRRHAAELLSFLSSPASVSGLLRAANQDADPRVRQAAVWALSEIDSPRVEPALKGIAVRDPDPEVRAEAEAALRRLALPYR